MCVHSVIVFVSSSIVFVTGANCIYHRSRLYLYSPHRFVLFPANLRLIHPALILTHPSLNISKADRKLVEFLFLVFLPIFYWQICMSAANPMIGKSIVHSCFSPVRATRQTCGSLSEQSFPPTPPLSNSSSPHRTALLVLWPLKPAVSSDRLIPTWQGHKIAKTWAPTMCELLSEL